MSKDLPVLSFERLTIDCIADVKSTFLQTLKSGRGAVIDFEHTETIDLAGIQLLLSFFRDAGQRGTPLRCSGTLCEQFVRRLKLFGFCNDACDSTERLCETLKNYFGER